MLKVGDKLPQVTLYEFIDVPTEGCSLGPNPVDVARPPQARPSPCSRCRGPTRRPARPSMCLATCKTPRH